MENWSNKEFVLSMIEWGGNDLKLASPELQDDEEVVLAAIEKSGGYILEYASERLRGNKEIVLAAIEKSYGDCSVFRFVTENLKDDEEMILAATAYSWKYFQYASDRLKKDRNFILQALGQCKGCGDALQYVDEELKADREFIMQAIKIDGRAIRYASTEIDILKAVKENASVFYSLHELHKINPEIVIEAAKQYDDVLMHTSFMLRDSEDVLIPIIEANPHAFRYASDRLKNDPKIIELYERKMAELGYEKEFWLTQPETEVEGANSNVEKASVIDEEKELTVEEKMKEALKTGDYATYKRLFDTLSSEEKINSILGVQAKYREEKSNRTPLAQREADLRQEEQISSMIGAVEKEINEQEHAIED